MFEKEYMLLILVAREEEGNALGRNIYMLLELVLFSRQGNERKKIVVERI